MDLPGGGEVTIIPAAGSNAIILSGAAADLKKVEELIEPLDVRPMDPETMGVQTFALEHADAGGIVTMVQSLLVEQQETDPRILAYQLRYSRNPNLFKKPTIHVEAEERTNSLIISAPSATLELAKTIIERLDQPAGQSDRQVATFTPAKAGAQQLVTTVLRIMKETMPQERRPLELTAEPQTGSVVAIGTKDQLAAAMRLLTEFDERAFAMPDVELTVVDLEHADAEAVAKTVEALAADRSRWPEPLRKAEQAGIAVAAPRVTADAASNRLVISAPGPLAPVVRELVATLDRPSGREVAVRLFPLRQGSAQSVAAALQTAFTAGAKPGDPPATATAEPTSNTVVVAGSEERLNQAESLVKAMDETVQPNGMGVRTIILKNALAESLAPILQQILARESAVDQLPEFARWQYLLRSRQPGDQDEKPQVRVAAEKRLNAVVIAAPLDVIDLAEQIVAELDVPPSGPAGGERLVRVIPLMNADAQALTANITAMFDDDASQAPPPVVRTDASGNALIVRATSGQMLLIEQLAKDLDAATLSGSRQLRMIPIDRSRADASLMAATIQRLLQQQGGVKVEIISTDELLGEPAPAAEPAPAEPAPAKPAKGKRGSDAGGASPFLGVSEPLGPGGVLAAAVIASAPIDSPGTTQPEVRPEVQPEAPPASAPDDEPVVRIAVDPASNSMIVVGSPRLTDRIAALAAELERQMPAEPTSVRIVTLPESADAQAISQIIDQTVRQIGTSSPGNPGGFTGRVGVQPDPSGSALIVWANETDFKSVGTLIASIARLDATTAVTVKNYRLENITADRAATAIRDLFSPSPRGRQARRLRGLGVTIENEKGRQVTANVDPDSVRITASPDGTSVLVAAPAEALGLIDSLVGLLDQSPVADRLAIRRYELKNARAQDLSRTFQTLFDAQRQGGNRSETTAARFVPDDRTNSILVTASARQHEEIDKLLANADAPQTDDGLELAIIKLDQADPQSAQRILDQIVIGKDEGKRERVQISAEASSGVLVVRASPEDIAEVKRIVAEIDSSEMAGLPVRTIALQKADAEAVAASLSGFFRDRQQAMQRSGRKVSVQGVAITGDRRSGTLVVAANDADFEQISQMVQRFDTESTSLAKLQFEVIPLENARVNDLEDTLTNLSSELQYERMYGNRRGGGGGGGSQSEDKLLLEFNERLNAVVVMGQGETLDVMKRIIASLDVPFSDKTNRVVKAVPISQGDPATIARVVQSAMQSGSSNRYWWDPRADSDSVTVEVDARRRAVILVGPGARVEQALAYVQQLDGATGLPNAVTETISLKFAEAGRAAQNLSRFFGERAKAQGSPPEQVSIIGSQDGNLLLVTADQESLALVKSLVDELDKPELGDDRRIDIVYLQNGTAVDIATAVRAMFPQSGRAEDRVIVTPQAGKQLGHRLGPVAPVRAGRRSDLRVGCRATPGGREHRLGDTRARSGRRRGPVAQDRPAQLGQDHDHAGHAQQRPAPDRLGRHHQARAGPDLQARHRARATAPGLSTHPARARPGQRCPLYALDAAARHAKGRR
ncbi:MAG: hypothetical protein IPJ41_16035 [Phycisphaerales bacterium]|nr:hypothetical protein [Phycisphaerales bacterium]